MTEIIRIGNRTITETEIISLLAGYRMLPHLWRELIIESTIASIELTPQQEKKAVEQFETLHHLTTLALRQSWLEHYGMTLNQLKTLAIRELKIGIFKQQTWEHCLESYFLTHKSKLDKVIYSLLRTQNIEVASELYFRIFAGEQSFAELACSYSTGPEAQTGGLIGPVELSQPHPDLAKMLSISQPGQLWPPTRMGDWLVIVRLEKFIPVSLDEAMRQQLLNELFEAWLDEQMNQLNTVRLNNTQTPKELVAV